MERPVYKNCKILFHSHHEINSLDELWYFRNNNASEGNYSYPVTLLSDALVHETQLDTSCEVEAIISTTQ